MHEMSLCESVVQVLEEQAAAQQFARVKLVRLEVGPFSGVELEALRFCFDAVTRGTLAEGAALEIISTQAAAWCLPCGKNVTITERFDPCPECGGFQLQVSGGDELRIKELEVD
jgi:hydrogenase nickel incorporation protein HypA/HybF